MDQILTNPPAANPPSFTKLTNLAAKRLGTEVLGCSDEFFAEASNLIKPERSIFIVDKYTDRGKWMDGWETRRHNRAGMDWALLKLGLPGTIVGFDIDTNFFTGNHAPFASVEACFVPEGQSVDSAQWVEILSKKPLGPGCQNFYLVDQPLSQTFTHLRLKMYPDGGIARLRVYGKAAPVWEEIMASGRAKDGLVDLVAVEHGGVIVKCSDMYFSHPNNLLMPGRGVNMGDGWETKRSRVENHSDWVVIKMGKPAESIAKIVLDTAWFKGNFPESATLEVASDVEAAKDDEMVPADDRWFEALPRTELSAHKEHVFDGLSVRLDGPITHVRMTIFPDGGVSRLRVFGKPSQ